MDTNALWRKIIDNYYVTVPGVIYSKGAYYISTERKFVSFHAQLSKFYFHVGWLRCYAAQQFISSFATFTPYFNYTSDVCNLHA